MAAENALKSWNVTAMIKQGFISDSTLSSSPSRTISKANSPLTSPSKTATLASPPPALSSASTKTPQFQTRPNQGQTLFEMMTDEHCRESNRSDDKRLKLQDRVTRLMEKAPFRNPNSDWGGAADVRLTVVSKDGFKVSMDVHKRILAEKSQFFADKLRSERGVSHSVEISDCDDVEVYVETVVLMYSEDLKKKLIGEPVYKILNLLKVSAALMFPLGVQSCLEYLEAVPWSEDEETKVASQLDSLQLRGSKAKVLLRISSDSFTTPRAEDIFSKLLSSVLQAKDDKARREMKALVSRLLREDAPHDEYKVDISKETLYHLCHRSVSSLILCLSEATCMSETEDRGILMAEITREADNIQWIVDILIEKKMGNEFVKLWADQKELAMLHSKFPTVYRHQISRITAQLCIAIGRGHILVSKETRVSLLSTWLEALYEDFGWIRRTSKAIDKKLVEDGLSQTILTLPLMQQQSFLLNWFDRFLTKGDDCPNIRRAFEVWWRRAFIKQYSSEQDERHLQITVCDYSI